MKNKLIILSLMVAAASTATAQTKEKLFSEKATDNVYISVGAGAALNMYDEDGSSFGDKIAPRVTVSLGKWFTPVWGIRGQVGLWKDVVATGWGSNGATVNGVAQPGTIQKYDAKNVRLHLDGTMNLSNLLCGYNPDRLFTLSVFAGPGLTIAKPYTQKTITPNADGTAWTKNLSEKKVRTFVNGSVGLLGMFNVSKYVDINLEVRGELSPSTYGALCPARTNGNIAATAGVTYTFGGKKFVSCPKVDEDAINAELNRYRNELAQAQADLAACRNKKPETVTKEVVKEIEVAGPRAIFFKIGKSTIDDYGKVNIQLAAKVLKANTDKKYKVAGYADKATGSDKLNQKLSEKRAQAVYDALISEGVSKDQLELVGFGGTANMFGKDYLNRVVILE